MKKSPPVAGLQIAVASRRRKSSEYLPGIPVLLALLGDLRPARSGDFFTTSEIVGALGAGMMAGAAEPLTR